MSRSGALVLLALAGCRSDFDTRTHLTSVCASVPETPSWGSLPEVDQPHGQREDEIRVVVRLVSGEGPPAFRLHGELVPDDALEARLARYRRLVVRGAPWFPVGLEASPDTPLARIELALQRLWRASVDEVRAVVATPAEVPRVQAPDGPLAGVLRQRFTLDDRTRRDAAATEALGDLAGYCGGARGLVEDVARADLSVRCALIDKRVEDALWGCPLLDRQAFATGLQVWLEPAWPHRTTVLETSLQPEAERRHRVDPTARWGDVAVSLPTPLQRPVQLVVEPLSPSP